LAINAEINLKKNRGFELMHRARQAIHLLPGNEFFIDFFFIEWTRSCNAAERNRVTAPARETKETYASANRASPVEAHRHA
jgi:hypothetical protein